MVECWEKEKSVAMAMAVLRIWHTKPESKKANVGVTQLRATLCFRQLQGWSSEAFFGQPRILPTVQYPSPPHKYVIKSILEMWFFPYEECVWLT